MNKSRKVRIQVKANIALSDGTVDRITLQTQDDVIRAVNRYMEQGAQPQSVELVAVPRYPEALKLEYRDALIREHVIHQCRVSSWEEFINQSAVMQQSAQVIDRLASEDAPIAVMKINIPAPRNEGGHWTLEKVKCAFDGELKKRGVDYAIISVDGSLDGSATLKLVMPDNPILASGVVYNALIELGSLPKMEPTVDIVSLDAVRLCTDFEPTETNRFLVNLNRLAEMIRATLLYSHADFDIEGNAHLNVSPSSKWCGPEGA